MSKEDRSSSPKELRGQLEEKILADHDRLGPDDTFQFACHPGISCFNNCCGDVNIFLSPYDVLRMKKRLGMGSSEFLEAHTILPVQKEMKTPVVVLRMLDDENKSCPFLKDSGCGVYSDRPWPCRMYPVGMAAQKDTSDGWRGERFYFLLKEDGCEGFEEAREWTVSEWMDDQRVDEWDEWGEAFKELTLNEFFDGGGKLTPEKMHMLFVGCYDLDRFRRFVFDSTLLEKFDIDEDFVEEMRNDDEALLRFSFMWLQFSLFGEKTMKVRADVLETFQEKLDEKEGANS